MLDLHTHILPGMDDGSRSVEQSLAMLAMEAEQGVDAVALTPHYTANRESPAEFIQRRRAAEQLLRSALRDKPGMPRLIPGAEVAYFDGMSRAEETPLLCLENTRAMLVEMPFCRWTNRMLSELEELRHMRQVQPVMAHVERYLAFQDRDMVDQLLDLGMWIQVNGSFFLQWQTSGRAMRLLRDGCIHFLGSDSHNLKDRAPDLGQAMAKIEKKLGPEALEFLAQREKLLLEG